MLRLLSNRLPHGRGSVRVLACGICALGRALPSRRDRPIGIYTARYVVTMDAQRDLIDDGAVAVRGERIVGVGKRADIEKQFQARQHTRPARDAILMPGLINTHTHAAMSLLRGIADDMKLQDWLNKFIFPAEAKNVTAGFRAVGHAPGVSRNDALRHHHLRRHVLFRGPRRASHQRSRHARHSGRDHDPLQVARRRHAQRHAAVHREIPAAVQRRSAHHSRRGAARHLYQ